MGEETAGVAHSCLGDGEWHCPGASDRGRGLPGVSSQSGVNSSLPGARDLGWRNPGEALGLAGSLIQADVYLP